MNIIIMNKYRMCAGLFRNGLRMTSKSPVQGATPKEPQSGVPFQVQWQWADPNAYPRFDQRKLQKILSLSWSGSVAPTLIILLPGLDPCRIDSCSLHRWRGLDTSPPSAGSLPQSRLSSRRVRERSSLAHGVNLLLWPARHNWLYRRENRSLSRWHRGVTLSGKLSAHAQ